MSVEYGQWYVIAGSELKAALDRVAAGDDPGIVIAEIYANSTVRYRGGGDDD